jgi:tetratricopeptide (TPR) repeat protein
MVTALVCALAGAFGPAELGAQDPFRWPERGENLQVLPEDFPASRLSAVMRGFSQALGVRCSYCHVGEEGQPLGTFDFVSDDNPNKDKARAMYRMLGMINDQLDMLEPSGDQRVNMWCHTCHNGKPRPQTLAEAIAETWRAEGGEAAVARFRELRERYYGGPQYDFRPASVAEAANGIYEEDDVATATALFEIINEHDPDAVEGWWGLGLIAEEEGRTEDAIRHFESALEAQPQNPVIRRKLESLRGG